MIAAITIGVATGVGGYTFIYANGGSYMTDNPSACANRHMPYSRVGAQKVSGHHVRSPLLNINGACQTCHEWPEEELRDRVHTIHDRTFRLWNITMDALIQLIGDIKAAKAAGRPEAELAPALDYQRKVQFYLDFIEAKNSMCFHASQEAARILAESINFSRRGQNALRQVLATANSTQ